MKKDIILAGVGGQGILSIAAVIGEAALKEGFNIKQAEVHGMSQRGGDVQSNLRISSNPIASDLIPKGCADIIISLEPMEALRYLHGFQRGVDCNQHYPVYQHSKLSSDRIANGGTPQNKTPFWWMWIPSHVTWVTLVGLILSFWVPAVTFWEWNRRSLRRVSAEYFPTREKRSWRLTSKPSEQARALQYNQAASILGTSF